MSLEHTYNKENEDNTRDVRADASRKSSESSSPFKKPHQPFQDPFVKKHSRYDRQYILKEIGREGQEKLDQSSVAIVGLGALGSVSANLLARAGIGKLLLIDRDLVEISNLQRQVLYDEEDAALGTPKAIAAEKRLRKINSQIRVRGEVSDVSASNIEELMADVDLIIDGTDNFETRFLINDYSLFRRVPWIYGGALRMEGMSYVVMPDYPPCLRCLFGEMPQKDGMQTCDQVGILGPVAHLIASFQATEAIKILADRIDEVDRKLWKVDIWNRHFKSFTVDHLKTSPCSGCADGNFPYLSQELSTRATVLCGRNAVQIYEPRSSILDLDKLARRLSSLTEVKSNPYLLRFRLHEIEMTLFKNGRAIIKGTENVGQARSFYSQYVGS